MNMEQRYFSLEIRDDNRLTRIFRIVFGLFCIGISLFWVVYNFVSVKEDGTQWITIVFLIAFGAYQVYAGSGFATRFIEFNPGNIRLKKNSIEPIIILPAVSIEKIELFPLKVVFHITSGKKTLVRFGVSEPEKISHIKDAIVEFAENNQLTLELINEEI
jgi:hypothetical protein